VGEISSSKQKQAQSSTSSPELDQLVTVA